MSSLLSGMFTVKVMTRATRYAEAATAAHRAVPRRPARYSTTADATGAARASRKTAPKRAFPSMAALKFRIAVT